MSKRKLVEDAIAGKPVDRVPVGFWFHYAPDELVDAFTSPEIREVNLQGHTQFVADTDPDFVKLMSDGYFQYPDTDFRTATDVSALRRVFSKGGEHPWIQEQIALVKELTGRFGGTRHTFYNIFSPATYFKFVRGQKGEKTLADFILRDKDAVKGALLAVAQDIAELSGRVITEGGASGIYFSTQSISDPRITPELFQEVVAPADALILSVAARAKGLNILHVCGYEGHRNDLSQFSGYDVQVVNWSVTSEGVTLGEGRRIFGGRTVLGGFDNTSAGILYTGTQEEIEEETARLLAESGRTGVILGADCTVPRDIDVRRFGWVREAARNA